jgi:hypothetical protein
MARKVQNVNYYSSVIIQYLFSINFTVYIPRSFRMNCTEHIYKDTAGKLYKKYCGVWMVNIILSECRMQRVNIIVCYNSVVPYFQLWK